MRSEQQMLRLITEVARADDRIRAVIMNGSRANPEAPKDCFQDFDIVYFVTDVEPYVHNRSWIARFGELMIMQMPEDMGEPPPADNGGFAYLMQFADGNRIDLTLFPISRLDEGEEDSLTQVLLDKDGIFDHIAPSSDRDYLPVRPTEKQFGDCCNEFFWVGPYVAKGLWRGEVLYAKHHLDHYVRDQLMKMLDWYVGMNTNFEKCTGKLGKYLDRYLEPELWEMLLCTHTDARMENVWRAHYTMIELFRRVATAVAGGFGFRYPVDDDRRVTAHLRHVEQLPRDAEEMY